MHCRVCKSENLDSNKFCAQCGAVLTADPVIQAAIREEIQSRLRDRNVVEVEVAEKVLGRISTWVKWLSSIVGLNIIILGATLTYLGVKSFDDIVSQVRASAEKNFGARLDKKLQGLQTQMTYLASSEQCSDNVADSRECHEDYPTGCSKSGRYDAYLNYLKNLTPSAPAGTVNFLDQAAFDTLNTNTPSVLGQGNNHVTYKDQLGQMGEGKQFGLVGYLYYYESTGAESSNCELTGPDALGGNVDFHIGIGFDQSLAGQVNMNTPSKPPKQLQQQSVIVEMTPHYRAQFQPSAWTLANLKPALGHRVRVVGQLLADSEHNKPSDNCGLQGAADQGAADQRSRCWRYSIWELHPVTSFEYCRNDSCTESSGNWIHLG